jgi:hypothetical protein
MGRINQAARRTGSGPPDDSCVRTDLTNAFYQRCSKENIDLDLQDEESIAFRNREFDIIEMKIEAAIVANDGSNNHFGRRILAILPQVYHEVETEYQRLLRRGVEQAEAKTRTLEHVTYVLELILHRYDLEQELAKIPENAQRTERLQLRRQLKEASHHLRIPGGPSAAENEELLTLLASMEVFSDTILRLFTSPQVVGREVQLLVTKDLKRKHMSYQIFSYPLDHGKGSPSRQNRSYHGQGMCSLPSAVESESADVTPKPIT